MLVEFGDLADLRRCFGSPEYAGLAPMREKSTITRSIVIRRLSRRGALFAPGLPHLAALRAVRAAMTGLPEAAREVKESGTFGYLRRSVTMKDLSGVMQPSRQARRDARCGPPVAETYDASAMRAGTVPEGRPGGP